MKYIILTTHRMTLRGKAIKERWRLWENGSWQLFPDGALRMPSDRKPRRLLLAIEQSLLQMRNSIDNILWTSSPSSRPAVIRPTANDRSQIEVEDGSR